MLWSLVIPASLRPDEIAQDLYLLWPGEVQEDTTPGKPEAALAKYVQERGFSVIGEGRLGLFAKTISESGGSGPGEAQAGGAPFVVFVQEGGALGLSPPATFIRIPWTPRFSDRGWLMDLRMRVKGLIKPRKATWTEELFIGGRYRLTMSYNEVRDRPLFPMYFAHRDRVVRLADAPSEIVVSFAQSDRLKIDDEKVRAWFVEVLRARTQEAQDEARGREADLQRQLNLVKQQQDELLNLRLHDWWYVGVPRNPLVGAAFSAISYATVLPAVRLALALVAPTPGAERIAAVRSPEKAREMAAVGLAMLAAAVAAPRVAFPFAWIFLWPFCEALLSRLRDDTPTIASPLQAWRAGRRDLVVRTLALGLPFGLVWESLNWRCARGWIYTDPTDANALLVAYKLPPLLLRPSTTTFWGRRMGILSSLRPTTTSKRIYSSICTK